MQVVDASVAGTHLVPHGRQVLAAAEDRAEAASKLAHYARVACNFAQQSNPMLAARRAVAVREAEAATKAFEIKSAAKLEDLGRDHLGRYLVEALYREKAICIAQTELGNERRKADKAMAAVIKEAEEKSAPMLEVAEKNLAACMERCM